MADWYVSAAAWTALPQFAASTAYTVGQIIRPLTTPGAGLKHAFRCTTAGTSSTEPTWSSAYADGNTIISGGATFTNVTGRSAHGWGAAAGDVNSISSNVAVGYSRPALGDRVFVASDHTESLSGTTVLGFGVSGYGLIQCISVNRAGSVPPVAADVQNGASITSSGNFYLDNNSEVFWHGFTFTLSGGTAFSFGNGSKALTLKNCAIVITATGAASIGQGGGGAYGAQILLDNVTVQFQNSGQYMAYGLGGTGYLTWINTPNAIQGAVVPTNLFQNLNSNQFITCRGVDLSAITTTLFAARVTASYGIMKVLLESCKIAAAVTRYAVSGAQPSTDELELVNCWDGTNVINERWHSGGSMTVDRSTTMNSGAQDDIGAYSLKLASSSRAEHTQPMETFLFDILNSLTGARTATVEIASSASLNNTDIRLAIEYQATAGSPVMSFAESIANNLVTAAALPSSGATWAGSPASKQQLQVSFTPAVAGRVRGVVKLNKASTNVWVNPQIVIS